MEKKLPGVFANKISKNASHNNNVSYTSSSNVNEVKESKEETSPQVDSQNVNQKINSIFSSTRYVYKADVDITLKDKIIKRKIIGKNSIHLITLDNELIPISDIIDIKFSN